ncbi:hypothetical protein BDQ17DRAFT_1412406 [Cyathus striatus]|nr:hypothetical protein BDQ17DRAFT_1412406 [Cyathus striatus]
MVLDARRTSDNSLICLKLIRKQSEEVKIAQFLSSERLRHHPNNHCVPIFDAFRDSISPEMNFLVMPVLRPFNDPDFGAVDEIVDFVSQILEGLIFMHDNLVAHGDATGVNVMMDARPILPDGWHFVADYSAPDGFQPLRPLSRMDHPVRYIFVDFGLSHRYLPGESLLVREAGGRDGDAPELYTKGPYNLFKLDVFTIGNMFEKDLIEKYEGLDFLFHLTSFMKKPNAPK